MFAFQNRVDRRSTSNALFQLSSYSYSASRYSYSYSYSIELQRFEYVYRFTEYRFTEYEYEKIREPSTLNPNR